MGIFSLLENLGVKTNDIDLYKTDEKIEKESNGEQITVPKVVKESDVTFLKRYMCPICDKEFKSLTIKTGKIRNIGQDTDLRPLYKDIDPIKYEPVVCTNCGYSAIGKFFSYVMPLQAKELRKKLAYDSTKLIFDEHVYGYEQALTRYQMALYSDMIGNVKDSRKAYTSLKMAWVIRGFLENESATLSENVMRELRENERECLKNAYDGFQLAFSREYFPICDMDEMTAYYLEAELAFRLQLYKESITLISHVLNNKNLSSRIRTRAQDLKDRIRADITEKNNESDKEK